MRVERDYFGSSGMTEPNSWRRACIPSTFSKTSRTTKSRRFGGEDEEEKDEQNANRIEKRREGMGEGCIAPRVVDYGSLYDEDIGANSTAFAGCRSGAGGA